ncbi:MAG: hypothetical protein MUF79_02990 [Burkholderiales bacterium]|jgi:hypothetical protein|nr:hypothetical protein [Burkholderiales bacterium]
MFATLMAAAKGAAGSAEPDADELGAWLATLPTHDASGAARLLIDKLVAINRAPGSPRSKIRLLDMLHQRIETVVPRLERALEDVALPLAPPLRDTAYLVEKLLKELGAGYSAAVLQTPRAWLAFGSRRQIHGPLVRAMDLLARRLVLTHRLYARSPGGVWTELHHLFGVARALGLDIKPTEAPATSAVAVYRNTLLLAFAEPSRLMPGELSLVQDYLSRFGALAEIHGAPVDSKPRGIFLIDPRRDRPGIAASKRKEDGPAGFERVLSTRALVERLESQFVRLQSGVSPDTLGLPEDAGRVAYRALLRRLAGNWRGEKRKRSARLRFHPRVAVHVGLTEAWAALGPAAHAAIQVTPVSEWVIVNESAGGFALRLMSVRNGHVAVGDVVLLRSKERNAEYGCIVRRVASNNPEHLEIGVQQLAPRVLAAVAFLDPTEHDQGVKALFCPGVPARDQAALLVVPEGVRASRRELHLRTREGVARIRVRRVAERTGDIELLEVDPA